MIERGEGTIRRYNLWLKAWSWDAIIYFSVIQLTVWGLSLLVTADPLHTTGLDVLLQLMSPKFAGWTFIACGIAALVGLRGYEFRHFLLVVPLMLVLFFAAAGAIVIIIQGHFATGEIYSRWFLLDDQLHHILRLTFSVRAIIFHFRLVRT